MLVCLILAGVVLGVFAWIWAPRITPARNVMITKYSVSQADQTIRLTGFIKSESGNSFSLVCYRGFSYEILDNDLYVTVKMGLITPKYRFSDFRIAITLDDVGKMNSVYVKGVSKNGADRQLIATRSAAANASSANTKN